MKTSKSQPDLPQPATFNHVNLVAHSDWSKDPAKRWMARAVKRPTGQWYLTDLEKIVQPSQLFSHIQLNILEPGCILAGFDFPIGLPSAYALKAGVMDFLSALPFFGFAEWSKFYEPAESPSEISLYRPFYPAKPGNSKRDYIDHALGIPFSQLFRLCEIAHDTRRSACPLFWTMGSQQVGKAAISGWQSLLAPAINDLAIDLKIWPFSGPIASLCQPGTIVVVETYPAEFYDHLRLSFNAPVRRSKRRQGDRLAFSAQLIDWAQEHELELAPSLFDCIQDGFGSKLDGEDKFDALVGLYGMLNVILGNRPIKDPTSPVISKIEGWIFGQEQP